MSLPSRAAALRGDDYQHVIGWYWAAQALSDPVILSVSIEDRLGGSFDDIVVRRRSASDLYWQVKSSNAGSVLVDESWLFTKKASARAKSPLQHFHATWKTLNAAGNPFELAIVTNRGFDAAHPILGRLRDLSNSSIDAAKLLEAKAGSDAAAARDRWAAHLGIEPTELVEFLSALRLKTEGDEESLSLRCSQVMRNAGLRGDQQAVDQGKLLVRDWVKQGAGPQDTESIRRQAIGLGLVAKSSTLLFAVQGIDREQGIAPDVELDIVELYAGDDSRTRYQLSDPDDWQNKVRPQLAAKATQLEGYTSRRVHLAGYMRLPLWFAVGWSLPDSRRWVLSLDQRGVEWRTSEVADPVTPSVLDNRNMGAGTDLALAVGLTTDPTKAVANFLAQAGLPVGRLLVLGPDGAPGPNAVPGAGWTSSWARAVRDEALAAVRENGAKRVHLFMAAPAGAALFLGHQWNMMPSTVVYEFVPQDNLYVPTLTL